MKRVLRWVAYLLAGLVALLLLAYATVYVLSARELARTYPIPDTSVTVPAGGARSRSPRGSAWLRSAAATVAIV